MHGPVYIVHVHAKVIAISFNAVNAFVELVEFLFTLPDVTVFLSNKLCQDTIEKFFGKQRQRGRVHDNPNVCEFKKIHKH